jgi:hypothetical protein
MIKMVYIILGTCRNYTCRRHKEREKSERKMFRCKVMSPSILQPPNPKSLSPRRKPAFFLSLQLLDPVHLP